MGGMQARWARWVIAAGSGLSVAGDGLFVTGLSWTVLSTSHSAVRVSVAMAAMSVTTILAMPLVTQILDRPSAGRWLVGADVCAAVAAGGFAGASLVSQALPVLIASGCVVALFSALSGPAVPVMLSKLTESSEYTKTLSLSQIAMRVGRFAGPAIGGVVVTTLGFAASCGLNALTYLVSAACWAAVRKALAQRAPGAPVPSGRWYARLTSGIRLAASNRYVRDLVLLALLVNTAISVFTVVLPVLVAQSFHANGAAFGVLQAAYQAGILASSVVFARFALPAFLRRPGLGLSATLLGLGGAFLAVGASSSLVLCGVFLHLAGWMLSLTSLITDSGLLTEVPEESRGQVFGLVGSLGGALRPAGMVGGGAIAAAVGASGAMFVGGGVCVLVAIARTIRPRGSSGRVTTERALSPTAEVDSK